MARNNQRGSKNNNPEGRNQFSNGWRETAKERPVAAAAVTAAAVGAGVFLWSRRNQITDQISNLSEQFNEWTSSQSDSFQSGSDEFELAETGGVSSASSKGQSGRRGGGRSARGQSGFGGTSDAGTTTGGSGTMGGGSGTTGSGTAF